MCEIFIYKKKYENKIGSKRELFELDYNKVLRHSKKKKLDSVDQKEIKVRNVSTYFIYCPLGNN